MTTLLPFLSDLLILIFIIIIVVYVIINFIIDVAKKVIKRISGSFDLVDIIIVGVMYYLLLLGVFYELNPSWLRFPAYIIITLTALYACSEEPKDESRIVRKSK